MTLNLTFLGQTLTFFVFVWFCWKYIWPPLQNAMSERQKAIGEGLAAAERAEKDLELAQDRATDQLRDAKEEAQKLLEQARSQRDRMIEEARNEAEAEKARILESHQADLENQLNRAKEQLRGQVAVLAVAGAEKILGASVDQSRHSEILDKLAAEL